MFRWRLDVLQAEILMRQGLYHDSMALLVAPVPPALQNSDDAVWQKLTLAADETYLGDHVAAERDLNAAESLTQVHAPQLLGEILLRRGTLTFRSGDPARALQLYQSTLAFARSHSNPFLEVAALGSLGFLATRKEHFDESLDWNQQALDLSKSVRALGSLARIEGNLAWSFKEMGDLDNARDLFAQADLDATQSGQVERRITWLSSVGDVLYELHEYAAAESSSSKALRLADSLHDDEDAISSLQNLALIALARNQFNLARKNIDDAIRREASYQDHARQLYSMLIAAHLDARTAALDNAESSYAKIMADPSAPNSTRWEALASLAQVHAAQRKLALADKEFAQSIDTISKAKESVKREDFRLSFLSSAIRFYDQYVNFLLAQNRQLDALKIADLSRAQTLEHGLAPPVGAGAGGKSPVLPKSASAFAIRPQETARRLGATLLFYQLGQEGSHLWVISPAKISLHSLPSAGEIDALVTSYRRSILEDPRDLLESVNASGKKLYEMLIQPVENAIPKGSRVIILPDGPLRSLNFESLPVYGPNPHYWIEDATISVASSLSLLSRVSNSRPPKSPNLLLFGDPDPPAKEFPRLGDASEEIRAVQNHFDNKRTTLFLKKDARASVYLSSDPGKYSYLHFATHGIASVTKPLESAIILTREGDSYKLYARDILQHPLNAYLVSISACDGSGKRNFAGEGLIGLSWAFLRAGAHNVVAGLWETSTASTPPIFDRLYQGVTNGEDPATALRNAKLALVHAKGASRRPFYWAPFQLYIGS